MTNYILQEQRSDERLLQNMTYDSLCFQGRRYHIKKCLKNILTQILTDLCTLLDMMANHQPNQSSLQLKAVKVWAVC